MNHAERAEIVARTAFATDWNGLAHTVQVVQEVRDSTPGGASDEELAAAWLHDVIEDTEVDFVDLRDMGFPEYLIEAVRLLTRADGSDYISYKHDLLNAEGAKGMIARRVKLADARSNLKRCHAAAGVPKWQRLAETRYAPLIESLEVLVNGY